VRNFFVIHYKPAELIIMAASRLYSAKVCVGLVVFFLRECPFFVFFSFSNGLIEQPRLYLFFVSLDFVLKMATLLSTTEKMHIFMLRMLSLFLLKEISVDVLVNPH